MRCQRKRMRMNSNSKQRNQRNHKTRGLSFLQMGWQARNTQQRRQPSRQPRHRHQQEAAKKIIALALSVRQAETLCKNMNKEPAPKKEPVFAVDYVAECEKSLSKQLGRGVKIVNGKRKGRFELEFYGEEDLQRLLDALMTLGK